MLLRVLSRAFRIWLVAVVGALLLTPAAWAQESGGKVYQTVLKSTILVVSPRANWTYVAGSGFLVDKAKNLAVTNYHVVGEADDVLVAFPMYKEKKLLTERSVYLTLMRETNGIKGKVVAREKRRDLALVQLQTVPEDAVAVKLAAKSPGPGEAVHSVGSPGRSADLWLYTPGRVRKVYQNKWKSGGGPTGEVLDLEARVVETDSPTSEGESGGPLVNDKAELVGVTQSGMDGGQQGSTFIDVSEVKSMLKKNNVKTPPSPIATASAEKPMPNPKPNSRETATKQTADAGDQLEQVAAAKLNRAKQLAKDGKGEKAKERYRDIMESFPKTKAGEEARRLLKLSK